MTLTFHWAGPIHRMWTSNSPYQPIFIIIRPRTSQIQILDLWPRWPWPLAWLGLYIVSWHQPPHAYQFFIIIGPRTLKIQIFDLWLGPDYLELSSTYLLIFIIIELRTSDIHANIWRSTTMTLTFGRLGLYVAFRHHPPHTYQVSIQSDQHQDFPTWSTIINVIHVIRVGAIMLSVQIMIFKYLAPRAYNVLRDRNNSLFVLY